MKKPRFGGLGGVMRGQPDALPRAHARSSEDQPDKEPGDELEDDETQAGDGKKKDKKTMEKEELENATASAKAEGEKAGFAAANARLNTVLASEHYAGREALAASLLGNEAMTADAIVSALATAPKAAVAEVDEATATAKAEEAARAEMRNQIEQSGNSEIEANGAGNAPGKTQAASAVWSQAYAKVFPNSKATAAA